MVAPIVIYGVVAAISAIGTAISGSSASSQNKNQRAWARYNADMKYQNDRRNTRSQMMLGIFNMWMAMKAGSMKAKITQAHTEYNASLIRKTMNYNDQLLAQEEEMLWESMGLDLKLLAKQRERERGHLVANIASSGTTLGVESNKDIIVEQRTQEALDAFVVKHNADVQAANIKNARAKNEWQGNMEIQKTIYNGEMSSFVTMENTRNSVMSMGMQTAISGKAAFDTANFALSSGMTGAEQRYGANDARISQNFTNGMFSAAGTFAQGYARTVPVDTGQESLLSSTAQVDHYGR